MKKLLHVGIAEHKVNFTNTVTHDEITIDQKTKMCHL